LHVFLGEWDSGRAPADDAADTSPVRLTIGRDLEVVPEDISSRLHLCSPICRATNVRGSFIKVLIPT
jgi:hypothetical protein